jgi:hypothetical protein
MDIQKIDTNIKYYVDKEGYFWIRRFRKMVKQKCPSGGDVFCGMNCPFFKVVSTKYEGEETSHNIELNCSKGGVHTTEDSWADNCRLLIDFDKEEGEGNE